MTGSAGWNPTCFCLYKERGTSRLPLDLRRRARTFLSDWIDGFTGCVGLLGLETWI